MKRIIPLLLCAALLSYSPAKQAAEELSLEKRPQPQTTYLSDIPGSVYAWLEEQQRSAYGASRKPATIEDLVRELDALPQRDGWEYAERILKKSGLLSITLPTRYEDPAAYILLNRISEDIRLAASKMEGKPIPPIYWGTLPIPDVNASAQKHRSDYVVILNHQLFRFLYSLLLIIDRTVVIESVDGQLRLSYSDEDFHKIIKDSPELIDSFAAHVAAFKANSDLPGLPLANSLEAPIVTRQLNAIERFIVGHEFGHVLAGHSDRGLRFLNVPKASGGSFRLPSLGRDWDQELEADQIGLRLAKGARTQDESGISQDIPLLFEAIAAYAPALFLVLVDSLDDASLCDGSGEGSRILPQEIQDRIVTNVSIQLSEKRPIVVSDTDASVLGCRQNSHPPAWLRASLALQQIDTQHLKPPFTPPEEIQFARALIANAKSLAKLAGEKLRRELE